MRTSFHHVLSMLLLAISFALVLGGCKSPEDKAAAQLVGTWEADMSTMSIEGMSDEEMTMVRTMLGDRVMRMTLNADGTSLKHTEADGEVEDEPGTWEVVSVDGDAITITGTEENEEDGESEERTLTMIDDDTFEMAGEENGAEISIQFNRVE